MSRRAVILLSGGIDSSVCLAMSKSQGFDCYALSIDYKQRNIHELQSAKAIAQQMGVTEHRLITCEIGSWGGSSLTDLTQVVDAYQTPQLNTYVPARNLIFLSLASGWAESLGASDIFFAANADDYDNYPDCRPEFFQSFAQSVQLGTRIGSEKAALKIHTPLILWNKAQIISEGIRLGVDVSITFSCYSPIDGTQPCQKCTACHLRADGLRKSSVSS